jgi:hypothetical protein
MHVQNLMHVQGVAAVLVREKLAELQAVHQRLQAERQAVMAQRGLWAAVQAQLSDLQAWCAHMAASFGTLGYQERRDAVEGLGIQVKVWQRDHDPHWEISASVPLDGQKRETATTTRTSGR